MRVFSYLNRRYTPPQFLALLLPSLAVLLAVQFAGTALGIEEYALVGASFTSSIAALLSVATLIDRRTLRRTGGQP
jgi:hypothetical protein